MRWLDRTLCAAFLLALSLPGVMVLEHGSENAKRAASIVRSRPNPVPALPTTLAEAEELPERFDDWFGDAWGGRERALRTNAWLSMKLFGTSPASHLFFGKDGWVFTRRSKSLESFTGTAPMSDDELAEWQRSLEDRRRWLAARGIDHVVVLVPHKSAIYPEKLPDAIRRARGTSRREQFIAWMKERSEVRVLDIAPGLLAAKPKPSTGDTSLRDLYSPLGVHWTVLGAHAAYVQIANDLAARHGSGPPRPLGDFDVKVFPGMGDSWAGRMLLDGVIEMKNLRLDPKAPTGITESRAPDGGTRDIQFRHPTSSGGEKQLRIVMAHDSFGPDIRGLIALQASLLETRWRGWLEEPVVERVQPDVVIELYSELILETQRPFRRPEFLGPEVAEDFAEAESLMVLDLAAPLDLKGRTGQSTVAMIDGAAVITLNRGVTRLRIPPPAAPPPPGSELILKLDVQTAKAGNIGLYSAERLEDSPDQAEFIPLEVGPETPPTYVPLIWKSERESTWLFMPSSLGEVTLRSVELRARARR